jgi:hypothetical protein
MRGALPVALALALAGCGDLFKTDVNDGYACSPQGTCPPGQQCVPGEHICRTPCTQTTVNSGGMTGSNGQCQNIHNGDNSASFTGYACDYDHFCRPMCQPNGGGSCTGCSGGLVCDQTINICRPTCVGGCATGWGCTYVGNNLGSGNGDVAVCAACRPNAQSTFLPPVFAAPIYYDGAAGASTQRVATGDLHGNGHASVIGVDNIGQKIYVFANDGSGALLPPVAYAAAPKPFDAIVADMNRDGKNDVVVATVMMGAGGPVLFPGNGDGTLGAIHPGPSGLPSTRLTLGDFDGDGKPEVAMCGSGTSQVSVVGPDGAGGLKTLSSFSMNGGNASFVRIGTMDFNGDKKLDLWVDDEHGGLTPFLGNGSFGFSGAMNTNSGTRADAISFDVDSDGKDDYVLVTANPASTTSTTSVVVLHNNGGLMFAMDNNYSVALPNTGHIVSGDFDGDGHIDAAMLENTTTTKSNIDILSNDGAKLVYSEQLLVDKNGPSSIAVADIDGDGKPDLVVGLTNGGVAVLLNQTPSR